jgi:hypothetical protein
VNSNQIFFLAVSLQLVLELFEFFAVRKEGSEIFSMKLGWRLFYFVMSLLFLFSCLDYLTAPLHGRERATSWWVPILLVVFLLTRPRTIVVNSTGLSSYGLFGLLRRSVDWNDVAAVTTDWEEEKPSYRWPFVFTGYKVAVRGRDGTLIEHTIFLRRLGTFLDDLRQHIPASAFAPGLYHWNP